MKKLSLFYTLYFVLCIGVASAYTMTDFDAAKYLADNEIITSQTTATKYRLDDNILRQEVIGMALKIKGVTLPENYTCKKYFADATKNDWVCRAVELAADNGIITRNNKYANPGKSITRAEAFSMVYNASGLVPLQEVGGYNVLDKDAVSWQKDLINKIYDTDLTTPGEKNTYHDGPGMSGYFYPNRFAIRSEVFIFTKNIIIKKTTKTETAYIASIKDNTITLDYFDIFSGEEAKKMAVADGECTQEQLLDENICFPNGVEYFRNINPKLRTFTLASDVTIRIAITGLDNKNISLEELKKNYLNIPFKITFNEQGEASILEEICMP